MFIFAPMRSLYDAKMSLDCALFTMVDKDAVVGIKKYTHFHHVSINLMALK